MTKILISDLYGTLIPGNITDLEYLYGRGSKLHSTEEIFASEEYFTILKDKMFTHLTIQLREFLENDNYLNVITALDSHDSASLIFSELLGRLYKNMEDYRDRISLFMVGRRCDLKELSTVAPIIEKKGLTYAGDTSGQFVTILKNKTEAFDFISERQNVDSASLYTIGDSSNDIPILFRCIDSGGQSALICHRLYTCLENKKLDTDEILHLTAFSKANMKMEKELHQAIPNFDMISIMDREMYDDICFKYHKEIWFPYYSLEKEKLYKRLQEGNLDLHELMKRQEIYDILKAYNDFSNIGNVKMESIDMERTNELSIYPTFSDFYNKVLTK